jgi:hypothetical protein
MTSLRQDTKPEMMEVTKLAGGTPPTIYQMQVPCCQQLTGFLEYDDNRELTIVLSEQ